MIKNLLEKYFQVNLSYFIKGGAWWILGRIAVVLIALAGTYFLSNWLTEEEYGTYQYVLSSVGLLALFSLPGINTSLVKSVAQGLEKTFFLATKTKIKWSFIGSFLALLASLWYFWHHNNILSFAFILTALFLPILPVFEIILSYFHGKKRFDLSSKLLAGARLGVNVSLIITVVLTRNLALVITVYFLSQLFIIGAIYFWTKKQVKDSEVDNKAVSLGKHLSLMGGIEIIANQIDKVIIWHLLGPASVAIYSIAKIPYIRIVELIPIQPLTLPKISEKNPNLIKTKVFSSSLKLLPFSALMIAVIIILAPTLYQTFFPKYLSATQYFQMLTVALIFAPFSLLTNVFIVENRKKELYLTTSTSNIIKVVLFFVLIPLYGILGAVLAEIISRALSAFLLIYFYFKANRQHFLPLKVA